MSEASGPAPIRAAAAADEEDSATLTMVNTDPTIGFPAGFLWGAATVSYQIEGAVDEGGRGPSVWDTFAHTEGKVAHGDTGDVACDHFHRVDEDVAMMAELGLQAYRFSISWSRVMPDGRGDVNQDGLDFYRRLVDRLLEHDIVPCPTLFHWDLPQALEELGGLRNRDTVSWFADYAALLARELGDRVHMWSTFNEPWCYAYLGHASGVHAPGLTEPHAAVTVAHHELLAHGLALQTMRAECADLELGIVINPSNIVTVADQPATQDQIDLIDAIHNRWWFDATLRGEYPSDLFERYEPLADAIQPGDLDTIRQPLDFASTPTTRTFRRSTSPRTVAPTTTRSSTVAAPIPAGSTTSTDTSVRWPTPCTRVSTSAGTSSGR